MSYYCSNYTDSIMYVYVYQFDYTNVTNYAPNGGYYGTMYT